MRCWVAPLLALLGACVGCGGGFKDAPLLSVASDATGKKLVAVGGGIWTSTDAGVSWIERTRSKSPNFQSQDWTSVASDATGTHLVAVVNGFYDRPGEDAKDYSGDVWTSSDSGVTWTDRTASSSSHGSAWRAVASDATGTHLIAATPGLGVFGTGAIWISTDAGATWANVTENAAIAHEDWQAVASDSVGQNLVAVGGSGVWTSSDGGQTWTDRTPVDPKFEAEFGDQVQGWSSVASDATGTKLVTCVDTGDIWTSSDAGVTWNDVEPAGSRQDWFSVASDSTGTNIVALAGLTRGGLNSDIWKSSDDGATWTDLTANSSVPVLNSITLNAAGDHSVAVGNPGLWVE